MTPGGRLDWLVFLALGLMWGSSYLFIKVGVETLSPMTLVALRLAIGATFLLMVVLVAREPFPREPRVYGHAAILAVFNIVLPFALITWATQSASSSMAAILTATVPLFVIVIAGVVMRDEPVTTARLAGLGAGFAGVLLVVGPGRLGAATDPVALLALLGAALCYAAGAVYARRFATGVRPMVAAVLQVGLAFAMSSLLAFTLESPFGLDYPPSTILAVVWLGLLGSGLAYLAFFRLIGRWGATRTSTVAYLLPVVAIALGVAVAGEIVDVPMLVGTALVIGGIALVNARSGLPRRRSEVAHQDAIGEPGEART